MDYTMFGAKTSEDRHSGGNKVKENRRGESRKERKTIEQERGGLRYLENSPR